MAKFDATGPSAVRGGSWTTAGNPHARTPQLQVQAQAQEAQQAARGLADFRGRRVGGGAGRLRTIAHIPSPELGGSSQVGPVPVQLTVPELVVVLVAGRPPAATVRVPAVQPVQDDVALLPEQREPILACPRVRGHHSRVFAHVQSRSGQTRRPGRGHRRNRRRRTGPGRRDAAAAVS